MKATETEVASWFMGALPSEWTAADPRIDVDGEEIAVVVTLPEPQVAASATDEDRDRERAAAVNRFREETRERRIGIATEAERTFRRKVSWGAAAGPLVRMFTTASVPAMTRLRMPERKVLDTLIEAGVARSRSEALAWCVRLVAKNEQAWLDDLRSALVNVQNVRSERPVSL